MIDVPPFWGKFDQRTGTIHPLTAHSADVAAVFRTLLQPGTALHDRVCRSAGLDGMPEGMLAALTYLAAIHDVGKVNHGFQKKAGGTYARPGRREGHVKIFLESIPLVPALRQLVRDVIRTMGLPLPLAESWLTATVCHHGRPWQRQGDRTVSLVTRLWEPFDKWDPLQEARRLTELAARWSGIHRSLDRGPDQAWERPGFQHLFAGVLTAADWIGSTTAAFPFEPQADAEPNEYWNRTLAAAPDRCRRIGALRACDLKPLESGIILQTLFPGVFPTHPPTPIQNCLVHLDLPRPGSRILVESETGSGKTEAVLALYQRLRSAGAVDGLVFALPTRATSTAMFQRLESAVGAMYPTHLQPTMALAIGGRRGETGSVHQGIQVEPILYPDSADEEADALASWSSASAKKFFSAEIVVGTVDQVLLAGLPVRHANLRMAFLARHLLVIDEVHSHDRYMGAVLAELTDFHCGNGGVMVALSATLSTAVRSQLGPTTRAESEFEGAVAVPYPCVAVLDADCRSWTYIPAHGAKPALEKTVEWQTTGLDEALGLALTAARAGARVCVLRNTVRGAVEAWEDIHLRGAEGLLWQPTVGSVGPPYHSRFIPPDRTVLDLAALAWFGRASIRGGCVLVATQVVEQSLDVDFDMLVTDLCPMDALIQRLGRLHRHPERPRPPGCETPRAVVVVPADGIPAQVAARLPNGWGTVYQDLLDLELTQRMLNQRSAVAIPKESRLLMEEVFHPSRRDALVQENQDWERVILHSEGRAVGERSFGKQAALDFSVGYADSYAQFDRAKEMKIRTRLGDDTVRVPLAEPVNAFHAPGGLGTFVDLRYELLMRSGFIFSEDIGPAPRVGERIYELTPTLKVEYTPAGWIHLLSDQSAV